MSMTYTSEISAVEEALAAFRTDAQETDDRIGILLFTRLDNLFKAVEALVADCKRALDEGDWA